MRTRPVGGEEEEANRWLKSGGSFRQIARRVAPPVKRFRGEARCRWIRCPGTWAFFSFFFLKKVILPLIFLPLKLVAASSAA